MTFRPGTAAAAPRRDASRPALNWLVGGGELGHLIREKDWSATPLGPPQRWPQSLRSAVSILLPSRAQICLFWGPELVAIYNDAYRPALGVKHPQALGLPARGVERVLGRCAQAAARRRAAHRRGLLGQRFPVLPRTPRLPGGDLLRHLLRPGTR
jgi:hypothetical protein